MIHPYKLYFKGLLLPTLDDPQQYQAAVTFTFENSMDSVLDAFDSRLIFQGNNTFKNNSALVGAGIYLLQSYLHVHPHTNILFENNHAVYVGGAIYTEDQPCFFDIDLQRVYKTINVNFINNTAGSAGSALYGSLDCCDNQLCEGFHSIFNIYNSEANPSAIVSNHQKQMEYASQIEYASVKRKNIAQTVLYLMFTTLEHS